MNIKEFNVTEKPFKTTLMFELYEGSDFDKKTYRILKKDKNLFAEKVYGFRNEPEKAVLSDRALN